MAYTNIDDPSAYFQVKLWTGNASTNAITLDGNSNMQPDFMWHKEHTDTNGWHQFDSSRGVTKYLASQSDNGEGTFSGYLSSFDSNGFTAGSGDSSMNSSGTAQCSWMWHCNSGTTSSNTDGTITSTVQANTTAGFSIVTYTGNETNNATVGHGLGVIPNMIIVKNRDLNVSWGIWHTALASGEVLRLNQTAAKATPATAYFQDENNTSSVFALGTNDETNENADNYVAYCFAEKQGYSKFGKYIGNGNANGPFVYTGFKPAFIMGKRTNTTGNWFIVDSKRDIDNPADKRLFANTTDAESTSTNNEVDLLSNGFKLRRNLIQSNGSGSTYTYMAFAENPFVTSTGIPTTAR